MASIVSAPSQYLWCDEHAEIAAWLARKNLGMEFYGSFVNYCARSMDKLRRTNNRLLKDHLFDLRKTLTTQPLSGAAVLHEMKYYHNRFFRTGTVKTGVCPLETLRKSLSMILLSISSSMSLFQQPIKRHESIKFGIVVQ